MKRRIKDKVCVAGVRRGWRALAYGAWLGLAAGLTGGVAAAAPQPGVPNAASASSAAALVARGAYLARAGDCVACHTASGGKPFAGGLKFDTPIGAIYSTNITPDPQTGLGGWTLEDFDRAVRAGVRKNGDTLYPAMPYP